MARTQGNRRLLSGIAAAGIALPAAGCGVTIGEPYNGARVGVVGQTTADVRAQMGRPLRASAEVIRRDVAAQSHPECGSVAESWEYSYTDLGDDIFCSTTLVFDDRGVLCKVTHKAVGDCGWSDR